MDVETMVSEDKRRCIEEMLRSGTTMNLVVVIPSNLKVRDGTSARVTGEMLSVAKRISKIFIVAFELNKELSTLRNVFWVRPRLWRGIIPIILDYMAAERLHGLVRAITNTKLTLQAVLEEGIIHVHLLSSLPLAYNFLKSGRLIIDLHGLLNLQLPPTDKFKDFAWYALQRRIEEKLLHVSVYDLNAELVVPSEMFKSYLVEVFGIPEERVHVVPDGIDLESIPEYSEEEILAVRRSLGVEDRPVVAYVGNVTTYHGFYDLVSAYKLVRRFREDAKFLFVVPQGCRSMVERILGGEAIIVENVPRRSVYRYLYAADVLVLPHRAGTQFEYLYSNKLLDYVASGKPIVAYSLSPVRNVLKEYPLKILVEPNNPKSLAEGVLEALKWRGTHVDGRKYLNEFDWKRIGERLYELYMKASK